MNDFLYGILTALALVVSVFFLKFWRRTREVLFAVFAVSFSLLALNWGILGAFNVPQESSHLVYLIRLVAFLVLMGGIVLKNLQARPDRRS